jgi:hypothetical protein
MGYVLARRCGGPHIGYKQDPARARAEAAGQGA